LNHLEALMAYLYLGALLFGGPHLFSTLLPGARDSVKASFGEKAWKGFYSLVSLAGIIFFILAYRAMGNGVYGEPLYDVSPAARHVTMLAALLMFILLGASHGKGYIKKAVRHPMSLGIALWSGAHLLANNERAVVWLFATLFVVAVTDLVFSLARGKKPDHVPQLKSDIRAVVIGMVLYVVFLVGFHPYVLGVPVVG
jgi:uncharacterized membrane protein